MSVSIALCTYNGAVYLEAQLRSILGQTRLPDELILRDDGSEDDTLVIAHRILDKAPFAVSIARNPGPSGVAGNFQGALAYCGGDIVFPCDQDDIWAPEKIATCVEIMKRNSCTVLFHDAQLINERGRPLPGTLWTRFDIEARRSAIETAPFAVTLKRPFATGCCMAIRREGLKQSLPIGSGWIHDEWITAVLAGLGASIRALPAPLVSYRQHQKQEVGTKSTGMRFRLRGALRADRERYLAEAEKFETLQRHLEEAEASTAILEEVRAKCRHQRMRTEIGRKPLIQELCSILSEHRSGRYRHFSWGRFGALKDLIRSFTRHV